MLLRGVAGVVVVGVLIMGCAAAPAPTASNPPTLAPTPAPASSSTTAELVTSQRFGYRIEMPAGWRYRAATTDWPVHTYPTAGATYTDNFEPGGAPFPALDISTQQLPDGQTAAAFLAELDAVTASLGYEIADEGEIVVDGVTGRLQLQTLGSESIWEVVLFDDGRVYAIYWVGLASQREADEPLFRHTMGTFAFPD